VSGGVNAGLTRGGATAEGSAGVALVSSLKSEMARLGRGGCRGGKPGEACAG
jgi:hypothetical protein